MPRLRTTASGKSGPNVGTLSIVNHASNYILTPADFNKIHIINSAIATSFILPAATVVNVGKWFIIKKRGIGNLIIIPNGTDTLANNASLSNTETTQTFAGIKLTIESLGRWGVSEPLGDWL